MFCIARIKINLSTPPASQYRPTGPENVQALFA
jgi:hypothetical protein